MREESHTANKGDQRQQRASRDKRMEIYAEVETKVVFFYVFLIPSKNSLA